MAACIKFRNGGLFVLCVYNIFLYIYPLGRDNIVEYCHVGFKLENCDN